MIQYENGTQIAGSGMSAFTYINPRGLLGRCVLPITRFLRVRNARRYVVSGERHLDVGCGDGYFLRRSPCKTATGMDMRIGDPPIEPGHPLPFEAGSFDLVTMLAVIEHVTAPAFVVGEVARVLRPNGRFVLTTPKRAADKLIRLYVRELDDEHENYFGEAELKSLVLPSLVPIGYHTFLFGLNQAFAAAKPAAARP